MGHGHIHGRITALPPERISFREDAVSIRRRARFKIGAAININAKFGLSQKYPGAAASWTLRNTINAIQNEARRFGIP